MQSLDLLKQEINQTMESEHDFAKWKLIVVAGLGGAALGLGSQNPRPLYWLMFFVPFVCAYIDLHCYQYQTRIMVIARFIREETKEDPILQAYERLCDKFRHQKVFYLGQYANVSASLGLSLLAPAFAVASLWEDVGKRNVGAYLAICLWIVGVVLIVVLWHYRKRVIERVNQLDYDVRGTAKVI